MKLSEEHSLIRDSVRRFTKNEIIPFAEQMDRDDYLQEDIFLKFGSLGILGITIPEEYGGYGLMKGCHIKHHH
jgi:isovaleryl-CoA dehydrogenase